VQKVNGRTVKTMAELCAALSAKVDPKDFWTIATAKSFTAFRVKDVIEYQAKHNGGNAPSNKPQFSGC